MVGCNSEPSVEFKTSDGGLIDAAPAMFESSLADELAVTALTTEQVTELCTEVGMQMAIRAQLDPEVRCRGRAVDGVDATACRAAYEACKNGPPAQLEAYCAASAEERWAMGDFSEHLQQKALNCLLNSQLSPRSSDLDR